MRRLAFALVAVLAAAAAPSARAETLDLDLVRLGAPTADAWLALDGQVSSVSASQAATLAADSRRRFAVLASQLGLALSSAILHPASTTGYSGFAVDLEVATVPAQSGALGGAPAPATGASNAIWPTTGAQPSQLYLPSVHVRKGLPFSFELGGRLIYLNQSSYYAAQGEAKWAVSEGLDAYPDLALRVAYTHLFGHQDLSLGATDAALMVSKRFGLTGMSSLTPWIAARYAWVTASSGTLDFAPAAGSPATQARFPHFRAGFYRTTVGLRWTLYAVALGVEGTYASGGTRSSGDYADVKVKSSFTAAAKLGWEF